MSASEERTWSLGGTQVRRIDSPGNPHQARPDPAPPQRRPSRQSSGSGAPFPSFGHGAPPRGARGPQRRPRCAELARGRLEGRSSKESHQGRPWLAWPSCPKGCAWSYGGIWPGSGTGASQCAPRHPSSSRFRSGGFHWVASLRVQLIAAFTFFFAPTAFTFLSCRKGRWVNLVHWDEKTLLSNVSVQVGSTR